MLLIDEQSKLRKEDYGLPYNLKIRPEIAHTAPHLHVLVNNVEIASISLEETPKLLAGTIRDADLAIISKFIIGNLEELKKFYKLEIDSASMKKGLKMMESSKSEKLLLISSSNHEAPVDSEITFSLNEYPIEKYKQPYLVFFKENWNRFLIISSEGNIIENNGFDNYDIKIVNSWIKNNNKLLNLFQRKLIKILSIKSQLKPVSK